MNFEQLWLQNARWVCFHTAVLFYSPTRNGESFMVKNSLSVESQAILSSSHAHARWVPPKVTAMPPHRREGHARPRELLHRSPHRSPRPVGLTGTVNMPSASRASLAHNARAMMRSPPSRSSSAMSTRLSCWWGRFTLFSLNRSASSRAEPHPAMSPSL